MEKYKKKPSELYSAVDPLPIENINKDEVRLCTTHYTMYIYIEYKKKIQYYEITIGNLSYMKRKNPDAFQKLLDDFYTLMEKGRFKEKPCTNKKIFKFMLDSLEPEKALLLLANDIT